MANRKSPQIFSEEEIHGLFQLVGNSAQERGLSLYPTYPFDPDPSCPPIINPETGGILSRLRLGSSSAPVTGELR